MIRNSLCVKNGQQKFSAFAFVCLVLLGTSGLHAQSKDTKGPPKPRGISLTAKDGFPLSITYYESSNGADAPVVVLLHGKGGSKRVWDKQFAPILQQNGYAVVAVDLRKHGQSKLPQAAKRGSKNQKKPASTRLTTYDYQAMVGLDLEAVWKFIFQEHQKKHLNMQKTALVAADMSVPIALNYTLLDWSKIPYDDAPVLAAKTPKGQTIRALFLISPVTSVPGVYTMQPTVRLKNPSLDLAFEVGVSKNNSGDLRIAEKLYKQVHLAKDMDARAKLNLYPGKLRGTDMLGRRLGVEIDILKFLDKHLKKRPGQWADRRPRFDREE
ncbi:MAG: alpha/beta hydrolase [Gimesia sp.]